VRQARPGQHRIRPARQQPRRDEGRAVAGQRHRAAGRREVALGHRPGRRLRHGGAGREAFEHHAPAPVVHGGPDGAGRPQRLRQGGGQGLAGRDAHQGQPCAERDALGQRDGGAEPREAARPHHHRDGVEPRRGQPGLGQHAFGEHGQRGGMAPRPVLLPARQHLPIRQQGGGGTGEGAIQAEQAHPPPVMRAAWPVHARLAQHAAFGFARPEPEVPER
jgi:hypothetical protein